MEKLWTNLLIMALLLMMSCAGDAGRPSFFRPRTVGEFSTINRNKSFLQSVQYEYETKYFTQRLDHFSFKNHKDSTFQQRYLIHDKYWLGAERMGPIFYYCGNEGYIDWFAENTGFMWDIAPQFGALLVFPEVSNSSSLINSTCLSSFWSHHLILQDWLNNCSEGYLALCHLKYSDCNSSASY